MILRYISAFSINYWRKKLHVVRDKKKSFLIFKVCKNNFYIVFSTHSLNSLDLNVEEKIILKLTSLQGTKLFQRKILQTNKSRTKSCILSTGMIDAISRSLLRMQRTAYCVTLCFKRLVSHEVSRFALYVD